jgi:hypothetical protein
VFLGPVAISVLFTLMSLPASVLGNEAAIRFGRHHAIATIMFGSAATALAIGLMVDFSPIVILLFLLVYGFTVPGESGALTSGMAVSANQRSAARRWRCIRPSGLVCLRWALGAPASLWTWQAAQTALRDG